jgi:hypothetical protein
MGAPKILDDLAEFFNEYSNPENIPDGQPRKLVVSNLIRYSIGVFGEAYFKWIVEESDFVETAKFLDIGLKKNQKIIRFNCGEDYQVEFERVAKKRGRKKTTELT